MIAEVEYLEVFLYNEQIGTIAHLPGDRNLFSFTEKYIANPFRKTLSLSFKDDMGELIPEVKSTRTRLPSFFSNLLPEGYLRDYLAQHAKVNSQSEFYLLAALGEDLPGALKIVSPGTMKTGGKLSTKKANFSTDDSIMRFSLAGVQLKFSANREKNGRLTIPAHGVGGSWIVKLPSQAYPGVPENEYVMMELARLIGIEVPETALIGLNAIQGIPQDLHFLSNHAYITKRFDRSKDGQGIHIEDFAQVFGVYSEKKYQSASYRNIAEVIWSEAGESGIIEFIRRFVFNALIGNGDMHLKNWSLIYLDQIKASLAPAYDFVSTIPYLPNDQLALSFVDSKAFTSLSFAQFKRFAEKTGLAEAVVLDTARDTVRAFTNLWLSIQDFPLEPKFKKVIDAHLKTIPLVTG